MIPAIFLMGYSLIRPAETAASARQALALCGGAVIPSLAVFLIGAKILIASDIGTWIAKTPLRRLCAPLGVSSGGLVALTIGLVAGFPMGAVSLAALVRREEISAEEATSLLPFCNAAGAGFVIGTVGGAFFGDRNFGVTLFFAQTVSALLLVLATADARRGETSILSSSARETRKGSAYATAIAEGALALLSICAFVLYFCVLSDALLAVAARLGLPQTSLVGTLLRGALELTGGLASLAKKTVLPRAVRAAPAGAMLGYGGLSVQMQVADRVGDAFGREGYLRGRATFALVCAGFSALGDGVGLLPTGLIALLAAFGILAARKIRKKPTFFRKKGGKMKRDTL